MSTQQRERFMDNLYKAGFLCLLAVCTYFVKDMHSDFKSSINRIEKLEIDISSTKVETINTTKQLDRVESALKDLSVKLDGRN